MNLKFLVHNVKEWKLECFRFPLLFNKNIKQFLKKYLKRLLEVAKNKQNPFQPRGEHWQTDRWTDGWKTYTASKKHQGNLSTGLCAILSWTLMDSPSSWQRVFPAPWNHRGERVLLDVSCLPIFLPDGLMIFGLRRFSPLNEVVDKHDKHSWQDGAEARKVEGGAVVAGLVHQPACTRNRSTQCGRIDE